MNYNTCDDNLTFHTASPHQPQLYFLFSATTWQRKCEQKHQILYQDLFYYKEKECERPYVYIGPEINSQKTRQNVKYFTVVVLFLLPFKENKNVS